jgi:O-antigen/teichoic acid export membrane protein
MGVALAQRNQQGKMFKQLTNRIQEKFKVFFVGDGLTARVGRGSLWAFVGFGGKIFLRMFSSLILTRIFLPEVFGLMAIITAVMVGIELLSNVGINNSIIQNPHAEKPSFLRTAWTLKVIRGLLLWFTMVIVSAPLANFYNEQELIILLPVMGLCFFISGFTSTSLALHIRTLQIDRVTILELFSQGLTLIFTIVFALYWKSIWAIIAGQLINCIILTVGSYCYLKGGVVGFQWDRSVVSEVIRFGKWIFIATVLTFIVGQGDRLILGAIMTKSELGLYNLAAMFSQLSMLLFAALISKSILPALSLINNSDVKQLSSKFNSIRIALLLGLLPLALLTAIFGDFIIELLYEPEYYSAGWMLQILSVGMIIQMGCLSISPIFLAVGDSFRHMVSYFCWAIIYLFCMFVGHYLCGTVGLIIGMSIAPLFWLPIITALASKYVNIDNKLSSLLLLSSLFLVAFGWWYSGIVLPE